MKYRECVIFSGARFLVPDNIQRIECPASRGRAATYGWQVRYGKDEPFFSDISKDGSGAAAALTAALHELAWRVHTQNAPARLRQRSARNKKSGLPPGISGPIRRRRPERNSVELHFQVVIPRYGTTALNQKVYIATERTLDETRYAAALARAIQMRQRATAAYEAAATAARRARTPLPGAEALCAVMLVPQAALAA